MKNIPNNPIKKIGKTTITLVLLVGLFYGINTYQNIMDKKNYVEPFCANKYSHNVEEYKACKVMTPTQILLELKEKNSLEIVDLPTIQ